MSNEFTRTELPTEESIVQVAELPTDLIKVDSLQAIENKELITLETASQDEKRTIEDLLAEIDLSDTSSVLFFGAKAQEKLTEVSSAMLEGVRNKDVGPAGSALNDMVVTLRGFHVEKLDPRHKPSLLQRLLSKIFGLGTPVARIISKYEGVRDQIDTIADNLDGHKTQLLTDIEQLDQLYEANLNYFHDLELYIAAGEAKLLELDQTTIPSLAQEVEASAEDMIKVQELRDLRSVRDDLERRVHDLKLTRQVTMQSLPSIRLVQENDKSLVNKINSTMVNTVPLWQNQLAQAVTIFRSGQAAKTLKSATDLTNDLLVSNAENLQEANAETRRQIERGVFDIESIKKAHATLLETIQDSVNIAEEGRVKRREAEGELQRLEGELKQALLNTKAQVPAEVSESVEASNEQETAS